MQRTTLSVSSSGGDHDHRDVLASRRPLELLEDGDPVELRHDDVEENDVARLGREELERFAAVRGSTDLVAVLLEEATEELPADDVVVGDEDRRGHSLA